MYARFSSADEGTGHDDTLALQYCVTHRLNVYFSTFYFFMYQVFFLLNKTNDDWWHVRKGSGKDGFVPANYVKEIEGKRIPVQVRQPFTVTDVRRSKKTRMAKKTVPIRKPKPPSKAVGPLEI